MEKLSDKQVRFVCELIWGNIPINNKGKMDRDWIEKTPIFIHRAPEILAKYPMLDKSFFDKTKDEKFKEMFELSFLRPRNFFKLPPEQQWDIDKMLGILDWSEDNLSKEESERFKSHYELKNTTNNV